MSGKSEPKSPRSPSGGPMPGVLSDFLARGSGIAPSEDAGPIHAPSTTFVDRCNVFVGKSMPVSPPPSLASRKDDEKGSGSGGYDRYLKSQI